MRRQALVAGMMGAISALAMAPQAGIGGVLQVYASQGQSNPGGKAAQAAPQIGRRSERFVGGRSASGIEEPRYRKRPFRTVAQDKRDATKKRNQRRNKR